MKVFNTHQTLSIVHRKSMGMIDITKMSPTEWWFARLIVPKANRNQGVATLLMEKLINVFNEDLATTIELGINPYGDLNYDQLLRFYEKYGFKLNENTMLYLIKE